MYTYVPVRLCSCTGEVPPGHCWGQLFCFSVFQWGHPPADHTVELYTIIDDYIIVTSWHQCMHVSASCSCMSEVGTHLPLQQLSSDEWSVGTQRLPRGMGDLKLTKIIKIKLNKQVFRHNLLYSGKFSIFTDRGNLPFHGFNIRRCVWTCLLRIVWSYTYFVGLIFIATYLQKTTESNSSKYPALQ